ncbi:MAG TPA: DUF4239 domain-containing protein [Solirubrobacteraceae bacterium]|jgi:hypothetical protein|nr:DUF4239 domain-containing protein [Solirubrobacteraceae bacterium]
MTRSLLNTMPTWLLAILVVGGAVAFAVAGLVVVRRRFPELHRHGINDVAGVVIGVLAAVFGIILGFVTVSLYESFTDAQATVQSEATDLIQLYEDSLAFPPREKAAVRREIQAYIATVRFREWDQMAEGATDVPLGREHVGAIYGVLRNYEPDTQSQIAFYTDAISRLNGIIDARRSRLDEAAETLPGAFWTMLVLGTLLLISSLYVLGGANQRLHAMLVVAVAVITSFNLMIVVALDHPFSGDISVSSDAFDRGQLHELDVTRADLRLP